MIDRSRIDLGGFIIGRIAKSGRVFEMLMDPDKAWEAKKYIREEINNRLKSGKVIDGICETRCGKESKMKKMLFVSTALLLLFSMGCGPTAGSYGVMSSITPPEEATTNTASISPEFAKALDWASRIKISGDMRFRHENIDTDEAGKGVKESRQRIRA